MDASSLNSLPDRPSLKLEPAQNTRESNLRRLEAIWKGSSALKLAQRATSTEPPAPDRHRSHGSLHSGEPGKLPLNAREPRGGAVGADGTTSSWRLLIVEDNAVSRRALELLFRKRGWLVSAAPTLTEGLQMLDPAPDCIIIDLMLPDGDGETLIRRVRSEKLQSRVIVTTGCTDPSRLAEVGRLKPEALLRKPFDFTQVLGVCR